MRRPCRRAQTRDGAARREQRMALLGVVEQRVEREMSVCAERRRAARPAAPAAMLRSLGGRGAAECRRPIDLSAACCGCRGAGTALRQSVSRQTPEPRARLPLRTGRCSCLLGKEAVHAQAARALLAMCRRARRGRRMTCRCRRSHGASTRLSRPCLTARRGCFCRPERSAWALDIGNSAGTVPRRSSVLRPASGSASRAEWTSGCC